MIKLRYQREVSTHFIRTRRLLFCLGGKFNAYVCVVPASFRRGRPVHLAATLRVICTRFETVIPICESSGLFGV